MPCSPSRTAQSCAAIARPALLTQYSPRFVETIVAETEVTKTMRPTSRGLALLLDHEAGDGLGEEVRPLEVGAQERARSSPRRPRAGRRARRAPRPALLTSTCSRPKRSRTAATSRARSAPIAEVGRGRSGPRAPSARSSSSAAATSARLAHAAESEVEALAARAAGAIPRPMPRVPPVTRATRRLTPTPAGRRRCSTARRRRAAGRSSASSRRW